MFTAAMVSCLVFTSDDLAALPAVTPNDPPAWFTRLLPSLKVGVLSKRECAELVADPVARVYIAAAILGDDQPKDKVLNGLFRDSVWANIDRRGRWQQAGRIDLTAEAAVVAGRADPNVAKEAGPELAECLASAIGDKLPTVLKGKFDPWTRQEQEDWKKRWKKSAEGLPWYLTDWSNRARLGGGVAYSWPTLRFGTSTTAEHVLTGRDVAGASSLADRVEFYGTDRHYPSFVVASDAIVNATPKAATMVGGAVQVSNGSVRLAGDGVVGGARDFVLVADGDITLPGGYYTNVLLVSRRSIRFDGGVEGSGGFYIVGDRITASKSLKLTSAVMLSSNGIFAGDPNVAGPDKSVGVEVVGVGPSDLGLRWFELADVGLEVVAVGKTAVVKRVADKSPFHGKLDAKDVLTAVNGTRVTTPDECRRALRRAVVLGYAVLDVQRDSQPLNRLVRVDDVIR